MTYQDDQHEYILTPEAYEKAYQSLPGQGTEGQVAQSAAVPAKQYRLNTSDTINAGKWVMWGFGLETFAFTWQNGSWQPPANVVVLRP